MQKTYCDANPFSFVRAKMVNDPAHYRWSSYQHNGLGQIDGRIAPHLLYLELGKEQASVGWASFTCPRGK